MFRRHNRVISGYLYGMMGDWGLAVDLTQETFIVAYRRLGDFDPARPAAPWLRGIARNLARNALRKRNRARLVLMDSTRMEELFSVLDEAETADERAEFLGPCLKRLPARQRSAVRVFYESGKSARDCAAALGVTEKTVFQLLWQARKNLRRCIERRNRSAEDAER